jgi:hypothetical protein
LSHTTARRALLPPPNAVEPLEPRALLASLSGLVYDDLNLDAERQPAEPALAGQTVELSLAATGRWLRSARP